MNQPFNLLVYLAVLMALIIAALLLKLFGQELNSNTVAIVLIISVFVALIAGKNTSK